MKKLYRRGTVHPSPSSISDHFSLSYLPATILTLTAALSDADKELLSYLLSSSLDFNPSNKKKLPNHHSPSFTCYCFNCYTTYWARWDSSPNRQLIHEIIDAFEESLILNASKKKKHSSNKRKNTKKGVDLVEIGEITSSDGSNRVNPELGRPESGLEVENGGGEGETGEKQGSVRKIVTFIGEKIWGSVWG